jgi:hypothetical protein
MRFTLDPKLMNDIHKQFTESESKTRTIQIILEAQLKTRQAVYEIVNNIPGGLGDKVLNHYYKKAVVRT